MTELRFSQEVMSHDQSYLLETDDIEMLLNKRSDTEEDVSDGAFEQVRRYLEKVSRIGGTSQEVNHELLQRVFKCLQVWALSPALSKLLEIGFVPLLATLYDNFIQSDYSRPEVLASILELLFVVEDMSDSNEGKIQCGELFLFRLLALATTSTKLPSVRLQRAAVETTCALVTRSPENQLAVLNEKVECNKLFKSFLPRCGDFQLQASVTEIFYRLLKKGPQLLDLVQDEAVRKSIQLLMQSKSPDLLSEIRTIVTRLNESLGHARSVYSFPVERILINGLCITTTDNWVNFGKARLSFFTLGLPDSDVEEPSIVDLQYEDIVEHKRSSPTLLEILLRPDIGGLSPFKVNLESGPSTVVRAKFFFSAADLSNVEANIFPKIRAVLVARQGKMTSNYSATIDKSTPKGPKRGPSNFKAVHATNINSHLRNGVSPPTDERIPDQRESRGLIEKSSLDFMHTSPDFVSQTPQDLEALEGVTTQDYARSKRPKVLSGITCDRPKSSKPPGRQGKGSDSQPVGNVPSTGSERCNPHLAAGQPFRRSQEDHLLQNNIMGSVDAHPNISLRPPIDGKADVGQSHRAAMAAKDSNKSNHRTSNPSRLETQNLQDLSGPKTKSPADATLRARLIEMSDDETTDETDNCERGGELRMKKRQDSHRINVVPLELTHHDVDSGNRLVGYTSRQLSNAELQETQRLNVSLEKNLVTSPRDMMGSDSVMTDIREKHVTSRQATKTCRQKSSRAVPNGATGQVENGAKTASRTLSKRKCKKTTSYFDADDDLTSAASHDSTSTECIVTRQKKSRVNMETDPIINKNAKHTAKSSAQTMARCGRRASIPEKSKTVDQLRNGPPNKQPCLQKTSTIMPVPASVTRKQSYSTNRQASHAATVKMCASSSRKDVVQDVYCFTDDLPEKQELPRKTSLALTCKARRNSDYCQPYRKRRKNPAGESQYNMQSVLYVPRQRSCISEGPRPIVPVRTLALTSISRPRPSPAGSASPKQDEVTPEQPGAKNAGTSPFSRSSDSEGNTRSPILRTQKTYTKSDKIITKDARRERWKSFSIRKLQFPTVDATFHDEFSDDATPGSSPHAKVFEVGDLSPDSEHRSGIDMIEKLLKSFKQKVKLVEKKKVGGILSNTMQRIDREIQSAEEQVRGEKTEFLDACKKKCGKLDSQLQEQIKKMREMYDKFRQEFAQHLERHDNIVGEIEEAELELNDLAKQQGQNHKDILTKLKGSCKNHLADADQKILDVGKGSTGMLGLKDALQGILKDL